MTTREKLYKVQTLLDMTYRCVDANYPVEAKKHLREVMRLVQEIITDEVLYGR